MSLASRVVWISMTGLLWSAACANELPEMAGNDNDKAAAGAPASPVVGGGSAGSASAPAASKPSSPAVTTPSVSGTTSQSSQSSASPAANSGALAGAGGAAATSKPAASSGGAGAGGTVAGPAPASAGSAAPTVAGSGGAAGAEAFPDLGEILPPLSTPETRVPSPSNPAECPATAPENPVGDCLGLPVYLECNYGTYYCVCDWFHWLCAG